jgi:hypothetical protein
MIRYVVTFFKQLVDSTGHPFKASQEQIELVGDNRQEAVEAAKERFADTRHVRDWTLQADSFELSVRP